MIELVNLRNEKPKHPWDVRVDRTNPLGNPFKDGTREEQCAKYKADFNERAIKNPYMRAELIRLYRLHQQYGKLRLFCWCVPLQCHSETIKAFLDQYINKE